MNVHLSVVAGSFLDHSDIAFNGRIGTPIFGDEISVLILLNPDYDLGVVLVVDDDGRTGLNKSTEGATSSLARPLKPRGLLLILEIELSLTDILGSVQVGQEERILAVHEDERAVVRRPTARDQLVWLRQSFPSEEEAVAEIAGTLIVDGPEGKPSRGLLAEIQKTLDHHDPLVQFTVTVRGPDCDCEQVHKIDLAELALSRMRVVQAGLLEQVHRLAGAYHWPEAEIVAMPAWRREQYIELLDRDGAGR